MKRLMWVSEWRIEPDDTLPFKVTNGGVYTPTDTIERARKILVENIHYEKNRYLVNMITCPSCMKPFSEHEGSLSFERCLKNLAVRDVL